MTIAVTVEIEGVDDAVAALEAIKARLGPATEAGVNTAAGQLQTAARLMASLFMRVWTGELIASIYQDPPSAYPIGPDAYEARVAPHVIYSRIQELGGLGGRKIPRSGLPGSLGDIRWYMGYVRKQSVLGPRPYLQAALDASAGPFETTMETYWAAAWTG